MLLIKQVCGFMRLRPVRTIHWASSSIGAAVRRQAHSAGWPGRGGRLAPSALAHAVFEPGLRFAPQLLNIGRVIFKVKGQGARKVFFQQAFENQRAYFALKRKQGVHADEYALLGRG